MIQSTKRGHKIVFDIDTLRWVYADTHKTIDIERPCKRCGKMPTIEGYDACMGYIPGVRSACCGHGVGKPILVKDNNMNYEKFSNMTLHLMLADLVHFVVGIDEDGEEFSFNSIPRDLVIEACKKMDIYIEGKRKTPPQNSQLWRCQWKACAFGSRLMQGECDGMWWLSECPRFQTDKQIELMQIATMQRERHVEQTNEADLKPVGSI